MNEIFYRELSYSDTHEYRRLRLECLIKFPDYFGTTFDEEFQSVSVRLENIIKEAVKNSFVMGAFAPDERLIGICGLVGERRLKTLHRAEIVQLFVDGNYTRQGIGKKLLWLSIQKAFQDNQTEQLTLGVVNENAIAIHLFKQLGFSEYGRLPNSFRSEAGYSTQVFFSLNKQKLKLVI
jgi:ribosomal protein S18 acetylase RimI-like enzyme